MENNLIKFPNMTSHRVRHIALGLNEGGKTKILEKNDKKTDIYSTKEGKERRKVPAISTTPSPPSQ